jgi:hypothetical protein
MGLGGVAKKQSLIKGCASSTHLDDSIGNQKLDGVQGIKINKDVPVSPSGTTLPAKQKQTSVTKRPTLTGNRNTSSDNRTTKSHFRGGKFASNS